MREIVDILSFKKDTDHLDKFVMHLSGVTLK